MRTWSWLTGLSLIDGGLHLALVAGALLALGGLLVQRRTRTWWTRHVPLAVAAALALLVLVWLVLDLVKPWPDGLPAVAWAWIGAGLLGLVLVVAGWRGKRWWGRALAAAAALLVVLGAADGIDTDFGSFPTVATALQLSPYDEGAAGTVLGRQPQRTTEAALPLQDWQPPADLPQHGTVVQVAIPPTRSGFPARPAWVYLPPAYSATPRPLLPVLMLIGGQPGGPRDWLDGGQLAQRMDAWAAAHHGVTPVVVMPDALGSGLANPLCLDSALGRDDTYLSQDVVDWVTSTLQVDPGHAHWAVGGFSYGGTCALQLAVAHPDLFPTFFDASGQEGPTLGGRARTVDATFGGNEAAFAAVEPLHELVTRRYPSSAAYLVVGAQDRVYRPQELVVAAAARAAGMAVTSTELPGGHSWSVWGPGFSDALPWLASRMGLPA